MVEAFLWSFDRRCFKSVLNLILQKGEKDHLGTGPFVYDKVRQ